MAMYDVPSTQLTTSLTTANPTVFTQSTVQLITSLAAPTSTEQAAVEQVVVTAPTTPNTPVQVTVASGTDIALVAIPSTGTTLITPPANIPVIVFESATGAVEVEFNDAQASAGEAQATSGSGTTIKRVVVAGGGSDKITVKDSKATMINASAGNNTITTGGGNDSIVAANGNDSLTAGLGNDTIVGGGGADTIDGGTGTDIAVLTGAVGDYTVAVSNGAMTVTRNGQTATLKNVEYVQLDNNAALIAAKSAKDATFAVLYDTLFNRTADASGLDYWIKQAGSGASQKRIGDLFVEIGGSTFSSLTDAQFVELLYQNTFSRSGDLTGSAYWLDKLAHGSTRGEVASIFAQIAVDNFGTAGVNTVGYVKIIDGLI